MQHTPFAQRIAFDRDGAALWSALYRLGRPVQYSYLQAPLALWSVQTAFAGRPWAAEMPSAGRPLAWSTLLALRARGVELIYCNGTTADFVGGLVGNLTGTPVVWHVRYTSVPPAVERHLRALKPRPRRPGRAVQGMSH